MFPAGTDLTVRREGTRLFAPGVGDDTRSLAVLLAWLRAMDAAGARTRADLLFVADVGEEGPGDLRGMRHLFQQGPYKDRISAFVTVDSPDMERIAVGGVGSKRYRVTFRGPGGHSYGAFGSVNPMFAMADAIARLGRIEVPARPKTTYSASVTGGGTSINSIPNSVWTEFDLRSEAPEELAKLEATLPGPDRPVGRGGECRAVDTERVDRGGDPEDRRPARGAHRRDVRHRGTGACSDQCAWISSGVRVLLDRCEYPDESGDSGDQDRLWGNGRAGAFAGGVDRCGARAVDPRHGGGAYDRAGAGWTGLGVGALGRGTDWEFQPVMLRSGAARQSRPSRDAQP